MACHLTFRGSEAVFNWCEGKTLAKCLLWHDRFSWRFTQCSKGRSPLFQKARETFLPQQRMTWENFTLFLNLYSQRALWSQLQQWNIQKQLTLRLKYLMRTQESRYVLWIRWVYLFKFSLLCYNDYKSLKCWPDYSKTHYCE